LALIPATILKHFKSHQQCEIIFSNDFYEADDTVKNVDVWKSNNLKRWEHIHRQNTAKEYVFWIHTSPNIEAFLKLSTKWNLIIKWCYMADDRVQNVDVSSCNNLNRLEHISQQNTTKEYEVWIYASPNIEAFKMFSVKRNLIIKWFYIADDTI
jgi:hypothetical protein